MNPLKQELALREILNRGFSGQHLPRMYTHAGWIKETKSDTTRRRLTSDAVGYGSSETPGRWRLWKDTPHGASAHRRTGRLRKLLAPLSELPCAHVNIM